MHDFVSHVLRKYYAQTDWNPFNSYLHLTSSSHAVLDFAIPTGLSLSISASPSPPFFTTYRLRALPTLSGALGYIYASVEDDDGNAKGIDIGGSSKDIRFKQVVDRFRILDTPWRPAGKEEVFQAGKRVDRRDYMLYGCMHVPSSRVDALFTTRLSPTWQLLMTAISTPPRSTTRPSPHPHNLSEKASDASIGATASQATSVGALPPGATNLQINLQNDTGRWFTEYSYSVDDGLLGFRVLHNLGQLGRLSETSNSATANEDGGRKEKLVDEESALESVVGGGLQGRFSVGAELFFSPLEKSAGLSTGVRFTTLPENVPSLVPSLASQASPASSPLQALQHQPSQPPTTITATLNPMMGHLSTAYAARMTRDIVACSRFDFNVYSYDSDLTLGAEYWIHSKAASTSYALQDAEQRVDLNVDEESAQDSDPRAVSAPSPDRQLQARVDTGLSLRDNISTPSLIARRETTTWSLRPGEGREATLKKDTADSVSVQEQGPSPSKSAAPQSTALGVIKARLSTSGNVALLWESRLRNCLVSFGIKGDLSSNQGNGFARKPLRGVGLDIIYFTQNRQED